MPRLRPDAAAAAIQLTWVAFACLLSQVVESPHSADGFLGQAIVGKADSHVVRVANDADANHGDTDPLPCLPARWAAVRSFSEIVVRDESQVLPLGYVVVDLDD